MHFFPFKRRGVCWKMPWNFNWEKLQAGCKFFFLFYCTFCYFIVPFKDVQGFFSSLPVCWVKHNAFSQSLAVMHHGRLQLFEEQNVIKGGRE